MRLTNRFKRSSCLLLNSKKEVMKWIVWIMRIYSHLIRSFENFTYRINLINKLNL